MTDSQVRCKFILGTVKDRDSAFIAFRDEVTSKMRLRTDDFGDGVREVYRCNSTDFHFFDAELLARLRKAVAVWMDLGSEEDSPGMNAMIQVLLRRRNTTYFTVLSVRDLKSWVEESKLRDCVIKDVLEVFRAPR